MFIPRGFMTLCDGVASVVSMFGDMGTDYGSIDEIVLSFGTLLSAGDLISTGLNVNSGKLRQIPIEFWRLSQAYAALTKKRLHGLNQDDDGVSEKYLFLIKKDDLIENFENNGLLKSNFFQFNKFEWDLSQTNPDDNASDQQRIKQTKKKGGRPPLYPWEDFWIEATLYVAEQNYMNDGTSDGFVNHMNDWVSQSWENPPDERTLERKFSMIGEFWDQRQKNSRK
jgi:hypothetical protein